MNTTFFVIALLTTFPRHGMQLTESMSKITAISPINAMSSSASKMSTVLSAPLLMSLTHVSLPPASRANLVGHSLLLPHKLLYVHI